MGDNTIWKTEGARNAVSTVTAYGMDVTKGSLRAGVRDCVQTGSGARSAS
jgi:hypothetical protein